jgi:hypothetical protein
MLTLGKRYYFDQESVREPTVSLDPEHPSYRPNSARIAENGRKEYEAKTTSSRTYDPAGRNVRTVWTLTTDANDHAHEAPMAVSVARTCIEASCPEKVCRTCGTPSTRIVERKSLPRTELDPSSVAWRPRVYVDGAKQSAGPAQSFTYARTLGWTDCGHDDWRRGVVLDPFAGSGTTAVAARALDRHAILVELSPPSAELISERLAQQSLFAIEEEL